MTKPLAILSALAILCAFSLAGCGENVAGKASRERQDTAIRETDNAGFAVERRLRDVEQEKVKWR